MTASPKRVYWDACTWIALIQKEKIRDAGGALIEDRETMCKAVIHVAKGRNRKIEIATSALSYVEVCKRPDVRAVEEDKIADFFENYYVLPINLDRNVGETGRRLMLAGHSKLKPADATHLASAAICNAAEMHTFDEKLLILDGLIDKADGTKLKIMKPDVGAPAPLLEIERQSRAAAAQGAEVVSGETAETEPGVATDVTASPEHSEYGSDEGEPWPESPAELESQQDRAGKSDQEQGAGDVEPNKADG